MLIKIKDLIQKYSLQIRGILHLGAHLAEEAEDYRNQDIEKVVWIEANPHMMAKLNTKLQGYPKNVAYNIAVHNVDGETVKFNITNNGESSSMLELETHKRHHPHIHVMQIITIKTHRMDTFLKENNINIDEYNFVNLDLQGVELSALEGFGDYLSKMDYIYTEVNREHLYKNCTLVNQLDEYLAKYDFKRVETVWTPFNWGDAFYMKIK